MTEKQDDQEPQRTGTHVSSQTVMGKKHYTSSTIFISGSDL